MTNRIVAAASVCLLTLVQAVHPGAVSPVISASEVPDIATDLVAHWRLDDGTGSSAWDDAGGHTGTLVNGATWTEGYRGSGVAFDGLDDYIGLPAIDVSGSALTIAAWVKSASFGEQRFISKATATDEQSHYWMVSQYNTGQPRLRFRLKAGGTTTTLIASAGTLPQNTWYHVAATYDGAAMRLFLNGAQVGVVGKSGALGTSSAVPVNIGRNPDGSNPLHGSLDDVRIYSRALTLTEISSLSTQTGDPIETLPPPDTQAPSAPTALAGRALSSSSIGLTWGASLDDVGVTEYLVYRNNSYIATSGATVYTDTALQPSTTYTYTVAATDAAGNRSASSAPVALATDAADTPTDLVAHWRLDDGTGSSAWDDAGGYTGTLLNGATWADGYRGGGVSFDGVNDYIALPAIDVAGSALTIAAWAKSASFGEQRFVSKATARDEQSHYWMLSQYNDGQPRLRFRLKTGGSTTTLIASAGTLPLNAWYHVAATYDGAAMRLYLNGTQVGIVAKSGALNTNSAVPVNIGRNPEGSNYLHGTIDDVRIYSRALTSGEITDIYVQPATGDGNPSPADTEAPAVPTGLSGRAVSSSQINLSWTASTDNTGVVGYEVYRNGTLIGRTSNTSHADSGLSGSTSYGYTVRAFDAAGNVSPHSASILVATLANSDTKLLTWSSPIAIAGAPHVTTTITGDFNGDGISDIAAFEGGMHSGAKLFAWFESPSFIKHEINPGFATKPFMGSAATGDINRDGRLDIVFSTDMYNGQEGWIYWAENPGGSATGNWPIHLIQYFPSGTQHINDMAVEDVDGDGKLDVVVRHLGVNRVRILFQDALPGSWTLATIPVKPREGLSVADLDGDGRKDLLLNGFWLAAPVNARTGTWTEYSIDPIFYTQPDTGLNNATKTAVGDIDGDGRIDVVISTAEGATGKFAWYSNPGNPRTQTWGVHVLESNSTGMHQAELGDIDQDGDLDVMNGFAFGATGIYAYLLNGNSYVRNTVTTATGLYFGKLADLDGDGDLDVVGPTAYAGQLYVYRNLLNTPR